MHRRFNAALSKSGEETGRNVAQAQLKYAKMTPQKDIYNKEGVIVAGIDQLKVAVLDEKHASAILGNAFQESTLNLDKINGDYWSLLQWDKV